MRLFALLLLLSALAVRAGGKAPEDPNSPEGVLWRFDSLLNTPRPQAAKSLMAGPALRMFDLILLSNQKLQALIDTSRSRDTVLERRREGGRAALKVKGKVIFKQPFMGMDSLASVQAIHFLRAPSGWCIANFMELPQEKDPLTLPSPADSLEALRAAAQAAVPNAPEIAYFPTSKRMLPAGKKADRIRYRISLGAASSLEGLFEPSDSLQSRVGPISPRRLILDIRAGKAASASLTFAAIPRDSFASSLASTPFLDTQDSALLALARRLRQGRETPAAYAQAVYDEVLAHFDFELGATLFGTSREALQRRRGDCSEGAVLTAALLRAQGIPARIAMGFATVGGGAYIGHAWCEAWLGHWVGIDAALREFPAGAQRVRLLVSDGQGDLRVTATNLVLRVLANLDIEMREAWNEGKKISLAEAPRDPGQGKRFFQQILDGIAK